MATLIGSESEGAGTNAVREVEIAEAFQFEATVTDTVEAIIFHTGSTGSAATSMRAAIVADLAGSPGTILGGEEALREGVPATNAVIEITGFSTPVTAGSKYWLILLPLGGSLKTKRTTSAGTPSKTNTTPAKVTKISEVTVWSANAEHGPMYLAGTGPGGGRGLSMIV